MVLVALQLFLVWCSSCAIVVSTVCVCVIMFDFAQRAHSVVGNGTLRSIFTFRSDSAKWTGLCRRMSALVAFVTWNFRAEFCVGAQSREDFDVGRPKRLEFLRQSLVLVCPLGVFE